MASSSSRVSIERISVDNLSPLVRSRHPAQDHDAPTGGLLCHKLYEEMLLKYKQTTEQSQQELASALYRVKSLERENAELRSKVENSEQLSSQNRAAQSSVEEELEKKTALSKSLQTSYADLEQKYGQMETAYHELSQKLRTTESSLEEMTVLYQTSEERRILSEENSAKKAEELGDLGKTIKEIFIVATGQDSEDVSPDDMLIAIRAIIEKNGGYLEKYNNLDGVLKSLETENNAGRATILRLAGELETEKFNANRAREQLDECKVSLQRAGNERAALQNEIDDLKVRLSTAEQLVAEKERALEKQLELMQIEITAARHETLETRNAQTDAEAALQNTLIQLRIDTEKFKNELIRVFKTHNICIDPWDNTKVTITVDEILKKLRQILDEKNELEGKLKEIQEQSMSEYEKYEVMFRCASNAEQKLKVNTEHVAGLESQIAFTKADIEELALLKTRFTDFIAKISQLLKLESIMSEVGLDLNIEAILTRVQKLADREDATLVEKSSMIRRLEKKIRMQKDMIESKELHLDMLRKKVANAEEESPGGLHFISSQLRTTQRQNEVLENSLKEAMVKIMELKTHLNEVKEVKLRIIRGDSNAITVDLEETQGEQEREVAAVETIIKRTTKKTKEQPYLRVSSAKINDRS